MLCPEKNCALCPRLVAFRKENQQKFPTFYNAPVPSFGPLSAKLLVLGMAPGLKGANQTGRPFTNDYAGALLYPVLKQFGLAKGSYGRRADDGFELIDTRVTNAVRCVTPQNKVIAAEASACRPFLLAELNALSELKAVLALGSVAHNALLAALGCKQSAYKFAHCARHVLDNGLVLVDSYHTSRYNVNTGVLTEEMFAAAVRLVKKETE